LIYQQAQANLMPLLSNLIGQAGAIPSLHDISSFIAAIGTQLVRSLGIRNPEGARRVQLVVAGWCPTQRALVAYEMRPVLEEDSVAFQVSRLDLAAPHFAGDALQDVRELYDEIAAEPRPGAPIMRAPLNVLREMIDDPDKPTIGGDVQVGFTVGTAFRRVRTLRPIPGEEPRAAFWLNAICTDELPLIGPADSG
jgi:hypothetical protein